MKRLDASKSLLVGLLLFGLFFGAGNINFPVIMGHLAGKNYLPAVIGFIITAVGIPILGIISSALSGKEGLYNYAAPVGGFFGIAFTVALYLTIGPLFAIPRTATFAYEVGIAPLLGKSGSSALLVYSLIFFALALYFSLKPNKLLDLIGRWMSPIFIGLLAILLIAVFFAPMGDYSAYPAQGVYAATPVSQGILEGYNTMDALASLAFAIIITTNLKSLGVSDRERMAKEAGKSGLITIVLMSLIYWALTYLGASSNAIVTDAPNGGFILAAVSKHYFGPIGQFLLAAIVAVACLKTAIGLIVSISETFRLLFPRSIPYRGWILAFTALSFGVANFGLNTIISLSLPVLMFLYPLCIALIGLWIIRSLYPFAREVFTLTMIFTAICAFFDFLKALPAPLAETGAVQGMINAAGSVLPFYGIGLGWTVPTLIAFLIALVVYREKAGDAL